MEFIQNNLLLIAVALVSGTMLIWPLLQRSTGGPWVSAAQATQLVNRENALLLDVRDPAEFAAGHILGARNVPVAQLDAGGGELGKQRARTLIAYCDNGNRASRAVAALKKQGFANVANLAGGYAAWQQAGLPVEK